LTDLSGAGGKPAFFGLVKDFPEVGVYSGDEYAAVSGCFDAFYAHGGDGDGHVGIVEGESAVCRGGVDAEEEEGGGCAEGEEVFYGGEEDAWFWWNETDCNQGLRRVGEGLEVLARMCQLVDTEKRYPFR
jgi:hypothetical protein